MQLSAKAAAKPGEIWLIEHDVRQPLAARDRAALTSANVVLYQRTLAPLVASILPIGAYAEALPRTVTPAISPRAFSFSSEGWSVVQLIEARSDAHGPNRIAEGLAALDPIGDIPVSIVEKQATGQCRECDSSLRGVPGIVRGFARETLLTLVVGPMPLRYSAPAHAFTANGLAG